jgi:molybdopterin converting factor small subunit
VTIRVLLPSQLQSYTGGVRQLEAHGATIEAALTDLDARFPGIKFRVIDEQRRVRRHMHIFHNGAMARDVAAPLRAGDELIIVGALSGG